MSGVVRITIMPHCKGCGICVAVCPRRVLEPSKKFNEYGNPITAAARPEDCIKCRMCEMNCPDFAVEVEADEE